jgi:hypothetical protein
VEQVLGELDLEHMVALVVVLVTMVLEGQGRVIRGTLVALVVQVSHMLLLVVAVQEAQVAELQAVVLVVLVVQA